MRTERRHTNHLAAFTLIELLVVVAIIAVLISILVPSLSTARKQAKQLLCLTNLRTQGTAAYYYAEANKDYLIGGVETINDRNEYISYPVSLLLSGGLAWKGYQNQRDLWGKKLVFYEIAKDVPQFNCPSHPVEEQHFDYVSSAIPIPYTEINRSRDKGGEEYKENARWKAEGADGIDYREAFRLADLDRAGAQRLVYVTEGHILLQSRDTRFHSFFLTTQLPFASYPRIANDQRHTGGINALFFDGSARTIHLPVFDVGWPRSFGLRLRYLTTIPEGMKQ